MRRAQLLWVALAAGALALALAGALATHRHPAESLSGGAGGLALQLAAALGAAAAAALLARQRFTRAPAAFLFATSVGILLEGLPLPDTGGAFLFTLALAGGLMTSSSAGMAAVAALGTRRDLGATLAGAAALVSSGLLLGLLAAATFDPRATGCFACPRNLLLLGGDAGLHDTLVDVGLIASAAACGAVAVEVLVHTIRFPHLLRRAVGPVVVAGGVVAGLGAVRFIEYKQLGQPEVASNVRTIWLLQCAVLVAGAAGVALRAVQARLLRERVASLVLAALPSAEDLRHTLSTAIGDPGLVVTFLRDGSRRIDADGREVPGPGAGLATTEVRRHGEVVAELHHARDLVQAADRIKDAALGAGLALEHASLHAQLEAELGDLTASRARVVELGDAERRRLERNLHDGAQQRLIALSLALQLASNDSGEIRQAGHELQVAVDNLRAIAHGIHPVSLTEAGLPGALREVADTSRVPVRIIGVPEVRLPAPIETAVHRLVVDSVRIAERAGCRKAVGVTVEASGNSLLATVVVPDADGSAEVALEHAADRFRAISGDLRVVGTPTGIVVEGRAPCAS